LCICKGEQFDNYVDDFLSIMTMTFPEF